MRPPPRARSVTPAPTLPPPEPDQVEQPERVFKRLEVWKGLLGLAVALLVLGAAGWEYQKGLARASDVDQVRAGAAASLASSTAGTTAQLGAVQAQQQDMRERVARVEASLSSITDDVRFLREQLVEIARATGARAVPQPPPQPDHPP